jgi:hypothetical protein
VEHNTAVLVKILIPSVFLFLPVLRRPWYSFWRVNCATSVNELSLVRGIKKHHCFTDAERLSRAFNLLLFI